VQDDGNEDAERCGRGAKGQVDGAKCLHKQMVEGPRFRRVVLSVGRPACPLWTDDYRTTRRIGRPPKDSTAT
jgi:hypothetical protein